MLVTILVVIGRINRVIREILDVTTEAWGVVVTLVELKDIQLPDSTPPGADRVPDPGSRGGPRGRANARWAVHGAGP